MALEKVLKRLKCIECGIDMTVRTVWLDNDGLLCVDCATIRRYMIMRRNTTKTGQKVAGSKRIEEKVSSG